MSERKESLRLALNPGPKTISHFIGTQIRVRRQGDRRGPNLNLDVKNPYVYVQIELLTGVFWATISRFVTQTLYWASRRPAGPQFEP